jgi:PPOX class probable F420-dependent enzyme
VNPALRDLVLTGPLCHLSTINPDGSPQVTVVWVGADGDDLVTAHLPHNQKVRNMERDPRVALSFLGPHEEGALLQPYAVVRARATVIPSDEAWDVLDELAKTYMGPGTTLPAPRRPGFVVRYAVEKVGGIGPWAP